MRMVKFHHRAATGAAPSPAAQLEAIMGSTEYVIWADDLGADASTVATWGPFDALSSPTVDADGYGGALKALRFNSSGQALLHPDVNLVTPSTPFTFAIALQLPTANTTRVIYSFGSSSTERHALWCYTTEDFYYSHGSTNPWLGADSIQPENVPIIMVVTMPLGGVSGKVKFYRGGGVTHSENLPNTLSVGATVTHAIGRFSDVANTTAALLVRFAALSVNQGALDEAGMDALSTFLQTGPYNCPLS